MADLQADLRETLRRYGRTRSIADGAELFNAEHDHAADEWIPGAAFTGIHAHPFAEADDHHHRTESGAGLGHSPHDEHSASERCSPCGFGFGLGTDERGRTIRVPRPEADR